MKTAFDPEMADFTGIADLLPGWPTWYISDVTQKAFIKVDEQGTEAAAATGVTGAAGAMSTTTLPLEMTINHPFVYLIRDVQSRSHPLHRPGCRSECGGARTRARPAATHAKARLP